MAPSIHLSVIAKTLEKSLLPYITANIPNTPMQEGYKTQHSTVKALHTLNNTVAKGSFCANNHCSTRFEQSFRTINIHTLIRKLLHTNIPGTIIKLFANYIKGRKHNIQKSHIQTTSYIYTEDLPPPSAPVQVMAYADDIISTHTSKSAA